MSKNPEKQPVMPHRILRRTLWGLSWFLVRVLFRLEYKGLENFPASGPAILVSNHTSMVDMLVIQTPVKPWVYWVAKKELFNIWLFGEIVRRMGCIPVDRDKSDLMAARGIITTLRDKQIVGMFPQGTRVKPDQIRHVQARSGSIHFAIKTGAPIVPVAVSGQFKLFHKIKIVYGKPYKLDIDPRSHISADELDQLTLQMMKEIYALIDFDYYLDDQLEGEKA